MKYLILSAIVIVYGTLGNLLNHYDVITHPAYWALYGYFFGVVVSTTMERFEV